MGVHEGPGGVAVITVEDDGPGVPPEMEGVLFEPFAQVGDGHRADQARSSPGVGIGLSLVARFTELHGGTVSLSAREGGGTSFRIELPPP